MLRSYLAQGMYGGPFQSFGGAVDIIVVQQADGSFKSSPWCVKFGDLQNALRRSEKIVEILVNDVPATFYMRVDNKGEAYFEMESLDDLLALPPPASVSPPPSLGDHPAEASALHNEQLTGALSSNNGDPTNRVASQTAEPQVAGSTLSGVDLRNPSSQTDSTQLDRGTRVPLVPSSAQTVPVERQQQTIGPHHTGHGASKRMPSAASSDTVAREQQPTITFSLRNDVAQIDVEQDASLSRAVTRDEIQVGAVRLSSSRTASSMSESGLGEERELQEGPGPQIAAMLKDGSTPANNVLVESASDFQMFENISHIQEAISRTVSWHKQDSGLPEKTVLLDLKIIDDKEESQGGERTSGNSEMEGADLPINGSSDATICTASTEAQESLSEGLQMMSASSSVTVSYSSSLVAKSMVIASVVSTEERLQEENNKLSGIVVNESEKLMTGDDSYLTIANVQRMQHILEAPKGSFTHSGPEESSMGRIGVILDAEAMNGPGFSDPKVVEDEEGKSVVHIGDNSGTGMKCAINKELAVSESASLLGAISHQGMNEPAIAVPGEINQEDDSTDVSQKSETKNEGVSVAAGSQAADTQAVAVVPSPSWWSLWPLSFRKSRNERASLPSKEEALLVATNIATQSHITEELLRKNGYARWTPKPKMRTYVPTSEQIASLNLKDGPNKVTFTFSRVLGNTQVDARIYLWKWNTRIVISDVDGTITKSDVLGQVMHLVGRDWSQSGVTRLFSAIKENGYEVLFLSARAISQAYLTRRFLFNLKQDGETLPQGPVFISPDGLVSSLYREVVRRAPHEFKISCLEGIRGLFPKDVNPFYAGFGNRDTDEISYLKVGIPKGKIFIINPKGEIVVNHHVDMKSYTSIHALVDDMFPPMSSHELEDFNSWNYWKLPLPDVNNEITVKQNVKSSTGSTKGGSATKR